MLLNARHEQLREGFVSVHGSQCGWEDMREQSSSHHSNQEAQRDGKNPEQDTAPNEPRVFPTSSSWVLGPSLQTFPDRG